MHDHANWAEAQEQEQEWWGNCANTLGEELKQLTYAKHMGLTFHEYDGIPYQIDLKGKSVLDIGGGPTSLLLKTTNGGQRSVYDPCLYPDWVMKRYNTADIQYYRCKGEDIPVVDRYDEVWMYNCLQHVDDPAQIIKNGFRALKEGGTFRIFEWINTEVNEAHPHSLDEIFFQELTRDTGRVVVLGENGCFGTAWCGIIST